MPLYNYRCGKCQEETIAFSSYENRPKTLRCECGAIAEYAIAAPVVHTLATHMMGAAGGMNVAGDGSYFDWGISDPATGGPMRIESLSQKRRVMKERGLRELTDSETPARVRELDRRRRTKPLHFVQ